MKGLTHGIHSSSIEIIVSRRQGAGRKGLQGGWWEGLEEVAEEDGGREGASMRKRQERAARRKERMVRSQRHRRRGLSFKE